MWQTSPSLEISHAYQFRQEYFIQPEILNMQPPDLYHLKQQFFLGAYQSLAKQPLPDRVSEDFIPALLYKARGLIALNDAQSALNLVPEDLENVAVKAVASLARYVGASDESKAEAALEELRDLAIEIEEEVAGISAKDKALVRVLASTAFARAGEVEEALETLGTETEHLESVALIVQIYLSINRPDLAKKQFERCKRWAEDDLLLQSIEAMIGLVTGKDKYSNSLSFYTEQLGNPLLSSPHLLTSRGVTRILRGEIQEAKSDLEESLEQQKGDAETKAAYVVSASLGALKKPEAEEVWLKFVAEHSAHPMVLDLSEKSASFDQFASAFVVPPLAV